MSLKSSNTLGAGDGLMQTITMRKRVPVPSSRKFATRGVRENIEIRQRLKEALDEYATPPQSPLIKRSRSIAEITPSKKTKEPNRSKSEVHESSRIEDAGRRVSHQLVLNAWRRRRNEAASLIESRDRLQTQVDQLQIQVDVLQKLREAEGNRRSEATNESKTLKNGIEVLQKEKEELHQTIICLHKQEEKLKITIDKQVVDLMNERNNVKNITNQKSLCEQAYNREKQQLILFREERNRLIYKIEECEREIASGLENSDRLKEVLQIAENECKDSVEHNSELEAKCWQLENALNQQKEEKLELSAKLEEYSTKITKLENKIHDLKKIIACNRQVKQNLMEENENLRRTYVEFEHSVDIERSKPWWKTTGEFMVVSLQALAYNMFPAIPQKAIQQEEVVQKLSIGLGKL